MKLLVFSAVLAIVAAVPDSSSVETDPFAEAATSCPCGWSNKKRIVGGTMALKNEFPLIVGLAVKSNKTALVDATFCGGSIITPRHILTAAHCTQPAKNMQLVVIAGAHNLAKKDSSRVIVDVDYTIEHENYDIHTVKHDIALVVLKKPLEFNQNIGPACLPSKKIPTRNLVVKALGWGLTKTDGDASPTLLKINLQLLPNSKCAVVYHRVIEPNKKPTQICAYMPKQDTCQGDSGGPLIYLDPETNRYTQLALVSFGPGTCGSHTPSINTDVAYYMPWIQEKIAGSGPGRTCNKL